MTGRTKVLMLLTAALAWPTLVGAQTVDMKYTGNYGWNYDRYYVGAYKAMVPYPGGSTIDIYCVDSAHAVSSSSWTAYVTTLGSGSSLGNTYLNGVADAGDRYWKAAYLITKFSGAGIDTNAEVASIHAAIWSITTGSMPTGFTPPAAYADWVTDANANWQSFSQTQEGQWVVLSDVTGSSQEFITHSSNVVPEPGTWVMLITGLVGVIGVGALRGRLV